MSIETQSDKQPFFRTLSLPQAPNLKVKIALPFCLIIVLVLSAFWLLARDNLREAHQRQADVLGSLLSAQTADTITELVLANDLLSLNVILNQLVRNDSIVHAAIYDIDDQIISAAGTLPSGSNNSMQLRYSSAVSLQNSVAGRIEIILADSRFAADLGTLLYSFLGIVLAGLVFCLFSALALANHLGQPLRELRAAMADPDQDLINADPARVDEVGELQRSCQTFLAQYREQFSQLYAGHQATHRKQGSLKGRVEATLLAVRVDNVDTMLALLNPGTLSGLLDQYYGLLNKASRLYGGTALRFTGDTLILAFDHQQMKRPVINAICCARLFQKLVGRRNLRHREKNSPVLRFSCAINSGEALVTRAGTRDHPCDSIMGNSVDEALRLLSDLSPDQVSVSERSYPRIRSKQPVPFLQQVTCEGDTDKPDLIHYILDPVMEEFEDVLNKQADFILPEHYNAGSGADSQAVFPSESSSESPPEPEPTNTTRTD